MQQHFERNRECTITQNGDRVSQNLRQSDKRSKFMSYGVQIGYKFYSEAPLLEAEAE